MGYNSGTAAWSARGIADKRGLCMTLDKELLRTLPKVLLHEHLDGVLRPQTVVELAKDARYSKLPTDDPQTLAQWFHQGANKGSLGQYLEGFTHTIAVMQTEEALERVAYEQAEDLSRDGVVYFETRFAPVFHTKKGLTHQQVVSSVLKGLERGRKEFRSVFRIDHLRHAQHERVAGNGGTRRRFSPAWRGRLRSGG